MVILTACGVSPSRLAAYTLVPALLVMLLVAAFSLFITPLGAARSEALLEDPSSSQGLQSLAAGRFQNRRSTNTVSYAQTISGDGIMHSVFLSQRERDSEGRLRMLVTVAEEGEVRLDPETGARYLELRNGYRYDGYPGRLDYQVVSFERFGELIPEPKGGIRTADPVDGRPTRVLLGSDQPDNVAALHWRLSIPLMVPVVAVIAMCLSRTDHRRGRYVKMIPAFLIYLAYLMLLANARSTMESGESGPAGNMWLIHALFLCAALAMLYGPLLWNGFKYRWSLHGQA